MATRYTEKDKAADWRKSEQAKPDTKPKSPTEKRDDTADGEASPGLSIGGGSGHA
jgi:hypothetical protein